MMYLFIFFRVDSPAQGQWYDYPGAIEVIMKDKGKIDQYQSTMHRRGVTV